MAGVAGRKTTQCVLTRVELIPPKTSYNPFWFLTSQPKIPSCVQNESRHIVYIDVPCICSRAIKPNPTGVRAGREELGSAAPESAKRFGQLLKFSDNRKKWKKINMFFLVFIERKKEIHPVQRDEVLEILFLTNYWVGWVGQSNFEFNKNTIIYHVNSFSSLTGCYLDGLNEQFFGLYRNIFRASLNWNVRLWGQ